jgi:hypothetical protein
VCRKVFKEARALRYHQIHHPQLLATPPAQQQQQQQQSVSANTPAMMNGFAGSFLNGCDYELDNKSGMISRKTNAQCGSGIHILDPDFSIPDQAKRGTGFRIMIRSKYILLSSRKYGLDVRIPDPGSEFFLRLGSIPNTGVN